MGTRRAKTDGPPPEQQTRNEKQTTPAAFYMAAGKWAAGIAASVLTAVLIYYLTGKQPPSPPKPPEKAGVTHYDHLSGVLSLDYPTFLEGVAHKSVPDAIIVDFGTAPDDFVRSVLSGGSGFMQVTLRPLSPDATARTGDSAAMLESMAPKPKSWWRSVLEYDHIVTTQRGAPPRTWLYVEREVGVRVIGPSNIIMVRHEFVDGLSVGAFAMIPSKTRSKFRAELDKAFASFTVNVEGARAFFAKPYYEEGLKHGKERRWGDAVRALQRALTIDPMHKNARHALALVYQLKGDYRLAWDQVHALQKMGMQVNEKFLQRLRADYPEPK